MMRITHPAKIARPILLLVLLATLACQGRAWIAVAVIYSRLSWSPDSKKLCLKANVCDDGVMTEDDAFQDAMIVNLQGETRFLTTTVYAMGGAWPALADDKEHIAFMGPHGLWVMGLGDASLLLIMDQCTINSEYLAKKIAWSPDNKTIACLSYNQYGDDMQVCILDSSRENKYPELGARIIENAVSFAWRDKHTLVYATGKYEVDAIPFGRRTAAMSFFQ